MSTLGRALAEIRARMGLSQERFAELIGVSQPTVSQRESGVLGVPIAELETLAAATGYSLVLANGEWQVVEGAGTSPPSANDTPAVMDFEAALRTDAAVAQVVRLAAESGHSILVTPQGWTVMHESDTAEGFADDGPSRAVNELLVMAEAGAGPGRLGGDVAERMATVALEWYKKADGLVRVVGDSMQPVYYNNDVIGVKRCSEQSLRLGKPVVARYRDQGAFIVKVYRGRYEGRLHLQSLNPIHEVVLGEPGELEIIGRPYGLLRTADAEMQF